MQDAVAIGDIGNVGPDYIPGHAHADTLSFEMSVFDMRFIVNSGTSVYGLGAERLRQRGTAAHSTVVIDGRLIPSGVLYCLPVSVVTASISVSSICSCIKFIIIIRQSPTALACDPGTTPARGRSSYLPPRLRSLPGCDGASHPARWPLRPVASRSRALAGTRAPWRRA